MSENHSYSSDQHQHTMSLHCKESRSTASFVANYRLDISTYTAICILGFSLLSRDLYFTCKKCKCRKDLLCKFIAQVMIANLCKEVSNTNFNEWIKRCDDELLLVQWCDVSGTLPSYCPLLSLAWWHLQQQHYSATYFYQEHSHQAPHHPTILTISQLPILTLDPFCSILTFPQADRVIKLRIWMIALVRIDSVVCVIKHDSVS